MLKEMYDDYVEDTRSFYECSVMPDGTMDEDDYEYWRRRVEIQTFVYEKYALSTH
jgi:hypothetical protein